MQLGKHVRTHVGTYALAYARTHISEHNHVQTHTHTHTHTQTQTQTNALVCHREYGTAQELPVQISSTETLKRHQAPCV